MLSEDRLFPIDNEQRIIAREIFSQIEKLPLICPHGHTEPSWFSENDLFPDPTKLLIIPDHYILRMLVSQGLSYSDLGIEPKDDSFYTTDSRKIWKLFAKHYYLFRGTPSRLWLDYTFEKLFGIEKRLDAETADEIYDLISEKIRSDEFRPRALYDQFNIEIIATTDACTDDLKYHKKIVEDGWQGLVVPTYRPDAAIDPNHSEFMSSVAKLGELTGEDTYSWQGYLNAHRTRRSYFKSLGATATDHGFTTAQTADLSTTEAEILFAKIMSEQGTTSDHDLFCAQMLTEMASMSIDDGLVMQLHCGSHRNHNNWVFDQYGRDKGFDIPAQTEYVSALQPLLNKFGMEKNLSIILFTLDETVYAREFAPLAGAYPCLKLGPAWWFHDSPEGMMRFRQFTTETAGFYNSVGFNDDTRAFPSIPARHDVARRVDASFLSGQVAQHILDIDEAIEVAIDLTYRLPKSAYNFKF
ncbi:glucuronate isomerase [Lentilitoribacter sp. EG35]|uniref:glucuronate isomerase n=1 Tax=Lentilitoribacter sp. EG35 TaxID=3234192 RepID=UPI00346098BE